MTSIDRRSFLKKSSKTIVAMGAATFVARKPARATESSEKVRMAAIGVGGRCSSLIRGFADRGDVDFVSLCDVYPGRDLVGAARKRIEAKQGKAPTIVQDFRRVLDDKSIHAVIIATPDHWHGPMSIFACQAEKDVYVEKPPSHNVWEGRKIVEAARRYRRIVQVGTQNRSAPYVHRALELIRGGALGDIHLCKVYNMKPGGPFRRGANGKPREGMDYDTWLGPVREQPYNDRVVYGGGWHKYWDFSGGDLADDGVHQLDIARWLVGKDFPRQVHASGGNMVFKDDREVPDLQVVTFDFDDLVMTFELTQYTPYMRKTNGQIRGGQAFPYWPQNSTRIELYGTKRLMTLGRHGGGWQIFTGDGKVEEQSYGRFPDPPHKEDFIQSVRSRKRPNADIEEGHKSATLVHLGNIAYRLGGRTLRFDGKTETFIGDAEANGLIKRDYRPKFAVPDVV